MAAAHVAEHSGPWTGQTDVRESLARHLREPYRTQVLCIHKISRSGACVDCGKPLTKREALANG